jgi:hypothetical protein
MLHNAEHGFVHEREAGGMECTCCVSNKMRFLIETDKLQVWRRGEQKRKMEQKLRKDATKTRKKIKKQFKQLKE